MSDELTYWIPRDEGTLEEVAHELFFVTGLKLDQPNRLEGVSAESAHERYFEDSLVLRPESAAFEVEVEPSDDGYIAHLSTKNIKHLRFIDDMMDGVYERRISTGTFAEHLFRPGTMMGTPTNTNTTRPPNDMTGYAGDRFE